MAHDSGVITMWGKTKSYKGQEYVQWTGSFMIDGRKVIVSIDDRGGSPVRSSRRDADRNGEVIRGIIYLNATVLDPNKPRGRRGMPNFGNKGGYK